MYKHTARILSVLLVVSSLAIPRGAIAAPNSVEERRAIPENTYAACTDHLDNDMDGHEDCDDQDCQALVVCASGNQRVAESNAHRPVVALTQPQVAIRRRATIRIVSGSLMLGFGVLLLGVSGALWWKRTTLGGYSDRGSQKAVTGIAVVMDIGGVALSAAGATYLTLGAGDAATVRYADTSPILRASF